MYELACVITSWVGTVDDFFNDAEEHPICAIDKYPVHARFVSTYTTRKKLGTFAFRVSVKSSRHSDIISWK